MVTITVIVLICIAFAWILQLDDPKDERLSYPLPLYKIEQGVILSKQGDYTLCYELNLPEIFTMSRQQFDTLHEIWVKAIKVLPENTVLHKQDYFTKDRFRADFENGKPGFLDRSSDAYFNERPFLFHRCYLMLTKKAADRKPASSVWNNLLRKKITPKDTTDSKLFHDFMDAAGQFETIIRDNGTIGIRRLSEPEINGDETHTGFLESYLFLQKTGEKPVIRDIELKPSWKIGEYFLSLFTLSAPEDLPPTCAAQSAYEKYSTTRTDFPAGFASPLGLMLDCDHIYNQFIIIDDARRTMKKLESKRTRLQSLSAYSRENALSRDAIGDFLNEAVDQGHVPIKAHFNIQIWTDDKGKLKDLHNQTAACISKINAQPRLETLGAPQLFWAGLPGNEADLPGNETFNTFIEQAVCFFNMETNYISSPSSVGVRLGDRLTGMPVNVDLSDEPMKMGWVTNRNKFILGPSGSGKSFLTNHLIRSYFTTGAHCLLVDVGHSYKGLCDLVNGYYFTYEENNPIKFNPFYIGPDEMLDTEKKESIKTLLFALWKKDNETFRRSEYVAISNALSSYYAYLDIHTEVFPCFDTFYDFLKAHFAKALKKENVKDKDFDMDNFLYVLRPFYGDAEFGYLLNAKENLDLLHQRFIVFELDNIKDNPILFSVVTLTIMQTFINKMRKLKGIRKIILIEEAWKAIAREGMAEYIKYLFKTVRKFYGEAWVVTQEVDDIISSPIVKQAVINNADCKILLDQSKFLNRFDQIQELLGLSDKDKALILSINKANDPTKKYKEAFIALGNDHSRVYRTEVSPAEYLTYTTEEMEKVMLQGYAEKYGSLEKGIAALLSERKSLN